eukprot:Nk52_evm21s2356 gene=Nk52_evmTU21s2356
MYVTSCPTSTAIAQVARNVAKLAATANFSTSRAAQYAVKPSSRVMGFKESVFSEFTPLALKYRAANLGQGFPDFECPDFIKNTAQISVNENHNQYTRSAGNPLLVAILAENYAPLFKKSLDPITEILVTAGATEALYCSFQAFIDPGDEVILMEPFYDAYEAQIQMAGGVPKYVPLREKAPAPGQKPTSDDWKLDMAEMEKSVSSKTKALVINNPHNPLGKVWSRKELEEVAKFAIKHDLIVVSDEVYEHLVFSDSPNEHIRIATLDGMWDRTVTVCSAGKTFSVTGWKIGWIVGSPSIIKPLAMAHQWIPFCVSTPLQVAVAKAYQDCKSSNYFDEFQAMFEAKRDNLYKGLAEAGFAPTLPHGGYFVMADTSLIKSDDLASNPAEDNITGITKHDYEVCRFLARVANVVAIPPSAFYCDEHSELPAKYARFAFCKEDSAIQKACENLLKFSKSKM